jgi:hypothetical protein
MQKSGSDGLVCFLCDFWWLILLILALIIAAAVTSPYWLPLLGVA